MVNRVFIGVAWPYANGDIHVGHFGGALLPADIFAKYNRMVGNEVLMVSGSDMHGTPITILAEQEKKTAFEFAMRYHERNKTAIEKSGIEFDIYTHTHTDNHISIVQNVFKSLYDKGYIIKKTTKNPYCNSCKRFLADRYIVGECPYCHNQEAKGNECDKCGRVLEGMDLISPVCKICGSVPEYRDEEEFYLKLAMFSGKIKNYLQDKKYWRENTLQFTENFLKEGLIDRAITRDLEWGVPLPLEGYKSKVIYVWFEAVCGYLSASVEYSKNRNGDLWKDYWYNRDCKFYYFLGKDNIIFHTIFWPSILTGYDDKLQLPYDIPSNEFVNMGTGKFSKSKGVSDEYKIYNIVNSYPPDMLRFYMTLHMPENHDTQFDIDDMIKVYNEILVDAYGNLVHRVLSFYFANFAGEVTDPSNITGIGEDLEGCKERVSVLLSECKFKESLETVIQLIIKGNKMFTEHALWSKIKTDRTEAKKILDDFVWLINGLLILMMPFTPFSSKAGLKMFGNGYAEGSNVNWEDIIEPPVLRITDRPVPLFKKIEVEEKDIELNIKIATIQEVEEISGSDKLYKIRLSTGNETRTVVAGIKQYYTINELKGKKIAMLYNLEEKRIKEVESHGMILAAFDGVQLSLLTNRDVKEGDSVDCCNHNEVISINKFKKYSMEVAELDKEMDRVYAVTKSGRVELADPVDDAYINKKVILLHHNKKYIPLQCGGHILHLEREVKNGSPVS